MGKGPAGFGLPVLVTLAYLACVAHEEDVWRELLRIIARSRVRDRGGFLIILAVALPWYVAMYVRHGSPFTDRLIFHDMFNRAFHHVHDTNEGDDTSFRFYVWQLGYALFPWTGLAPLGLLWWLRRSDTADTGGRRVRAPLHVVRSSPSRSSRSWGRSSTTTSSRRCRRSRCSSASSSTTCSGPRSLARRGSLPVYLAGIFAGAALMVLGVARTQPGSFLGTKPDGHLTDPSVALGVGLFVLGAGTVALFVRWLRCTDAEARKRAGEDDDGAGRAPCVAHDGRGRPWPRRCSSSSSGAISSSSPRARISRARSVCFSSSRTTTGARWPDSLDFTAALDGLHGGRRGPDARTRGSRRAAPRRGSDVRVRVRLGGLGPRRLHDARRRRTGASTRSSRPTTRTARRPTRRSSPTR